MPAVRLHDDPCRKGLTLRCRPQIRTVHRPIHQQLLHQLRCHLHTEPGEIRIIPPQLEAKVAAAECAAAPGFHLAAAARALSKYLTFRSKQPLRFLIDFSRINQLVPHPAAVLHEGVCIRFTALDLHQAMFPLSSQEGRGQAFRQKGDQRIADLRGQQMLCLAGAMTLHQTGLNQLLNRTGTGRRSANALTFCICRHILRPAISMDASSLSSV